MNAFARLLFSTLTFAGVGCAGAKPPPAPAESARADVRSVRATEGDARTRRALLIGVADYADPGISDLEGPPNDLGIMRGLLANDTFGFTEIVQLQDAQATRAGILAGLDAMANATGPNDVVVVYYSGHGSVVRDHNDDESDGLDETIVPHDAKLDGTNDVLDDELGAKFAAIAQRSPYLTFISDSCHAGTNTRFASLATRRFVDRGLDPMARTDASGVGDGMATMATIAGAQPDEYSYEAVFDDGVSYGALTHALVSVLSSRTLSNYRSLEDQVTPIVTARFPRQHPRFEGAGLERSIFGVTVVPTAPYVLVEPKGGDEVWVEGGAPSGLATEAIVEIYPPGTNDFAAASPIAKARVKDVVGARSVAQLNSAATIPAHSRGRLVAGAFGSKPLTVAIDASVAASQAAALRFEIAKWPSLEIVSGEAALRIFADSGMLAIVGADGGLLTRSVPIATTSAATRVADQLHRWARWYSIANFANPASTLPVALNLGRMAPPSGPPPTTVTPGENLYLQVVNRSSKDVYFVVLDLSSDGSIAVAYPHDGRSEKLPANSSTASIPSQFSVPEGRSFVDDKLIVVAATQEFPAWSFEQEGIRALAQTRAGGCAAPPCGSESEALTLLAERATATPRAVKTAPLNEWSTAGHQVRVVAARPLLNKPRIAVHFEQPTSAAEVKARALGRPALCPVPNQSACADVAPLDASNTVFAISTEKLDARGPQGTDTHSVGQAFSDAYRAASELGADYAEPLLQLAVVEDDPLETGARGGGSTSDPIAAGDDRWNHRYAFVPAAWQLRHEEGAETGQEAAGVLIGHPDTGYTLHPEIWQDVAGRTGPLDMDRDWNYLTATGDALDPRVKGLLKNPGHGTAASSVIVSPAGCASTMPRERCVTGVAQGARLVPLRVHKSVVVFDSENLILALNDIAAGKRGDVDLVSLAMGGPPSRALHKAVQALERAGIPLLAAAGNQVKTVVWPARFDEAIAVTAVNTRCELWSGASLGPAVDIAAPGESVWRATFDDKDAYDIAMGEGTTFATGTTAGVAALWIAHNRGSDLDALVRRGALTSELRTALRATSWRPDKSDQIPTDVDCTKAAAWRPRAYGAGIVNAQKLLARPLSNTSAPSIARGSLPLFSSLYLAGTSSDRIESDYRQLFASGTDAARFETELMYHYTTNDAVRDTLDGVVESTKAATGSGDVAGALARVDLSPEMRGALPP